MLTDGSVFLFSALDHMLASLKGLSVALLCDDTAFKVMCSSLLKYNPNSPKSLYTVQNVSKNRM